METFISLGLLAVVLTPLCIVVRDFLTTGKRRAKTAVEAFYDGTGSASTFPSLATLKDLEETAPTFVKRNEWWTE